MRLPFVHFYTVDAAAQEDLRRADERQERVAHNLVQSFTPSARRGGGGWRPFDAVGSSYFLVGTRGLGRGPRKTQKARRSSAGALLIITPHTPLPQICILSLCRSRYLEATTNEHLRNRLELIGRAGASPRYTKV
jgi:hypothetical protein